MQPAKFGQQEQIVAAIALKIRQSLDLESILTSTVVEIRELIQADRVLICRFSSDGGGVITHEAVSHFKWSIINQTINDDCFKQCWLEPCPQGYLFSTADIYQSNLSQCHREFLASLQVRANIALPILLTNEEPLKEYLWGLLIIHQCSSPRNWQESELELLQLLSLQVAIAIQQGQLYQQVQTELHRRRQAEELQQVLTTFAPVGIFQTDAQGDYLFVNQRWQAMTGLSFAEALGQGWIQALHPEEFEPIASKWYEAAKTGREFNLEYRFLQSQGKIIWVAGKATPLYNETGAIAGYLGTVVDISDRHQREEILKDIASGITAQPGEHFFDSLVQYLTKVLEVDYAFVCKLIESEEERVRILAFYDKHNQQTQLKDFEHDLTGTPCEQLVDKQPYIYSEAVRQLFPNNQFLQDIKAEGYAGMPIFTKTGAALGLIGVIHTQPLKNTALITEVLKIFATRATIELERQQTELALRQSEEKFRAIFDHTFQFIGLLKPDGTLIEANKTALDFVGLTIADVRGQPFWLTPWWSMSSEIQAQIQQAIARAAQGEFVRFEVDHPGTEDRVVTVDFSLTPVTDQTGKVIMLIPEGRNISQLKQAEEQIRQQAALLDVATDAIMVRGLDNQILFWNQGAERLYGWTAAEVLNQNANQLLYCQSLNKLSQIQQVVKDQGEWQGELNQVTKAGKNIVVESRWTLVKDQTGNPQSYLVVNTDITEQKLLETQFLRTQRLESLGTLAGGIAHDLNNILVPILGFAKLLPLKLPDIDEQTKRFFKIIETNAQRGSALVKQILTFSRGLEGDRGIVQIRHLIAEIEQIIQETFPKSIELAIKNPNTLWTVKVDVNQLHQVLMNLTVNARDAMPSGGKLTISAENVNLDANYARLYLDAAEGSYVLITVSDTGVGIPPEIIDRIFEPFFTTKKIGQGTGLGLSTVIGIVKSHGGFVDVISNTTGDNRGTQVKVFLPASDSEEMTLEETETLPHGKGELILVVDDESSILEVTKATLETYNYQVMTAQDGIEAIAAYAHNLNSIKAVIMDMMMPNMEGKTAILALKEINPAVPIIAVSGLVSSQEIISEINEAVTTFLAKPYSSEDLLKAIAEVIISY